MSGPHVEDYHPVDMPVMSGVPGQVYLDAAAAAVATVPRSLPPQDHAALVEVHLEDPIFRAIVESAYRAGRRRRLGQRGPNV